jgi:hypothetical protein
MVRVLLLASVLSFVGLNEAVRAQPDDGPERGVARISLINGDVSVKRGDSGDMVAAGVNAPLVVEDRVITGPASRAEVQFDYSNMIRLSAGAEIRLAELEYKRYLVQVARGTVTFRVLRDQEADVELSTPSVSVRPVKRGIYRVSVHPDGTSEITVRSGEAEVFTPKGSERLRSGHTMIARGTQSDPEFQIVDEIRKDDWDDWNERRDRDLERSRSYRYLSRDIYGAEDLDYHGRWVNIPSYGWCWSPRVAAGWAPYRYGRWGWLDFYGWSWISYDPWGWAPYHYGRWFWHAPYGWTWYPGSFYGRHYWSPALVAFFGFGGVNVGFGFGRVGWVPLAPYEPFHRWWGPRWYRGYRGGGYINNSVNIVNNVNITNVYRNARVVNAVTGVDRDGFGRGVPGSLMRVSDREFTRASLVRGALPVAPGRESLRFAEREVGRVAESRGGDRFFSRRQPARVERVPFEDQRRAVEQVAQRTFDQSRASARTAEVGGNGFRAAEDGGARSTERSDSQRGWRRVGDPAGEREAPSRRDAATRGSEWRRFGSARVTDSPRIETRRDQPGEFGNPTSTRSAEERSPGLGQRSDGENWRRFGGARLDGSRSEDSGREVPRSSEIRERSSPRFESPRREQDGGSRSFGSDNLRGFDSSRRSEPRRDRGDSVRISPPIVRERDSGSGRGGTSPGFSRRGSDFGGSRGGGMRSASPSFGGASRSGGAGGGSRGGGGGARGADSRGGRGR